MKALLPKDAMEEGTFKATDRYCRVSDLEPAKRYKFRLRAKNGEGWGLFGPSCEAKQTFDAPFIAARTMRSLTVGWRKMQVSRGMGHGWDEGWGKGCREMEEEVERRRGSEREEMRRRERRRAKSRCVLPTPTHTLTHTHRCQAIDDKLGEPEKYELQIQEASDAMPWSTISSTLTTFERSIERLLPATEYRFRVRPYFGKAGSWAAWSGSACSYFMRTQDEWPEPVEGCMVDEASEREYPVTAHEIDLCWQRGFWGGGGGGGCYRCSSVLLVSAHPPPPPPPPPPLPPLLYPRTDFKRKSNCTVRNLRPPSLGRRSRW